MIVVLASRFDGEARAFANGRLAGHALLLTPADLSSPHWTNTWRNPERNSGELGGHAMKTPDVSAVLSLLPAVTPHELPHVAAEDQDYVAAEMHAFLRFWLSELSCPIYNRPKDGGLCAAPWSERRWRWAAAQAGFPPAADIASDAVDALLSVVGGEVVGGQTEDASSLAARRLAEAAGASTLTLHFRGGRFAAAYPRPLLAQPMVADALQSLLLGPKP